MVTATVDVSDDEYVVGYGVKECTRCKQELPWEDFAPRIDQGVVRRRRTCISCMNEAARRRIHKSPETMQKERDRVRAQRQERRAELTTYKMERGCADCGYSEHPAALDFDHRPNEVKLFMIMRDGLNRAEAAVWAEVAKCDVVCANCHRIRTANRVAAERTESE